jgi:hypothetical protein
MDIDVIVGQINKLKDLVIQLHERNFNLIRENNRLKDENEKLLIDVAFLDGRMEDKRTIFKVT